MDGVFNRLLERGVLQEVDIIIEPHIGTGRREERCVEKAQVQRTKDRIDRKGAKDNK